MKGELPGDGGSAEIFAWGEGRVRGLSDVCVDRIVGVDAGRLRHWPPPALASPALSSKALRSVG